MLPVLVAWLAFYLAAVIGALADRAPGAIALIVERIAAMAAY